MSKACLYSGRTWQETPEITESFRTINDQAVHRHRRVARMIPFFFRRARHRDPENKRPVRGDNRTGQSRIGAWGGWALAPNTANGEGLPLPHVISRGRAAGRSKRQAIF